ncbi:uncharacterized protein TRIADDRAFT_4599, partial [Trichoplax adhaerens]
NPHKSIKQMAHETGIARTCAHRILTQILKLKPYKQACHHELFHKDYKKRKDACNTMIDSIR